MAKSEAATPASIPWEGGSRKRVPKLSKGMGVAIGTLMIAGGLALLFFYWDYWLHTVCAVPHAFCPSSAVTARLVSFASGYGSLGLMVLGAILAVWYAMRRDVSSPPMRIRAPGM
jgi:uncharacterized membrane-anchored protein